MDRLCTMLSPHSGIGQVVHCIKIIQMIFYDSRRRVTSEIGAAKSNAKPKWHGIEGIILSTCSANNNTTGPWLQTKLVWNWCHWFDFFFSIFGSARLDFPMMPSYWLRIWSHSLKMMVCVAAVVLILHIELFSPHFSTKFGGPINTCI